MPRTLPSNAAPGERGAGNREGCRLAFGDDGAARAMFWLPDVAAAAPAMGFVGLFAETAFRLAAGPTDA